MPEREMPAAAFLAHHEHSNILQNVGMLQGLPQQPNS
jgi:hypothetical protein